MKKALTTSGLPPIAEHKLGRKKMALTTNKTEPVWPVPLGDGRRRFTGKGMVTTGNLEEIRAEQAKAEAKKNGKGK